MANLDCNTLCLAMKITILANFCFLACTPGNHKNIAVQKTAVANLKSNDTAAKTVPGLKKDSVIYNYEALTAVDKTCNDCHLTLSYPLIKNKPGLHEAIENTLYGYTDTDHKEEFKYFFKRYAKTYSIAETGDTTGPDDNKDLVLYTELNIEIEHQDDRLIILNLGETTSGGAHPNYHLAFITWDVKADKEVGLDDIFVKNYQLELTEVASKIFTKDAASDGKTIADYRFEDGVFALNDSYKLTPQGIYFYYNNYEISSYAEGPTELLIPYSSVKHLLRPNTVVTQYLK